MATILATSHKTYVALKPASFLADSFQKYRTACRGSRYDPKSRSSIVPKHAWPTVLQQLEEAGFTVQADSVAESWRVQQQAEQTSLLSDATIRIGQHEHSLSQRGMKLRPYQMTGIRWLSAQRAGLLADEQGLGKTVQALCAIPSSVGVI